MKLNILSTKSMLLAILSLLLAYCISVSSDTKMKSWDPESGREPKKGDIWINPIDGYILVWIPPGSFMMGSDNHDVDEKPRHKVYLSGFWIGKYEFTSTRRIEHFVE